MMFAVALALAALVFMHLLSVFLAALGLRRGAAPPTPEERPPVSLLRPVRGLENHLEETLRSAFRLRYPQFEMLFLVADTDDPALPLVQRLCAEHPHVDARLLVGEDRASANPKLDNIAKGWRAARHDWIVMADSNIVLASDYLDRLVARMQPGVGLVSTPGIGGAPEGRWAELECAFLNTHEARWLFAAEMAGLGYAQGKTMLMRRSDIERAGGFAVLTREIAEDSAATRAIRGLGMQVRLARFSVVQPLGRRSWQDVWGRQVRWSRLRRASFPVQFGLEVLTGLVPAMALLAVLMAMVPVHPAWMLALMLLWYGAEAVLARIAGWHLTAASPAYWALRDLLIPVLWLAGWRRDYVWHGHRVDLASRTMLHPKDADSSGG